MQEARERWSLSILAAIAVTIGVEGLDDWEDPADLIGPYEAEAGPELSRAAQVAAFLAATGGGLDPGGGGLGGAG